jgi:uncharacterized delta-60 repeat protein
MSSRRSRRGLGLFMATALLVGSGCAQTADDGDGDDDVSEASAVRALDPTFGLGGVSRVSMSPEADRFVSVANGEDGQYYAAGFLTTTGDQSMAVARFDENGDLDTEFADKGYASVNVAVGGKTGERASSMGVLSDGSVVLAGPVEHDPAAAGEGARDTDIAAVKINDDGTQDMTFGENGVARFDLGTGRAIEDNFVGDTMFGLTVLEDDKILIVGAKLHDGPDETDRDFAILRLTEDGKADTSFAEEGVFVMDIDDGNESPRQALELDDGSVVVSGYSGVGDGPISPVLFKLDDAGELVTEFGDEGIASAELLPAVAEAYEVGLQGDSFIITGYGRATEDEKVDMIAARFTSEGELDTEFGEDGLVRIDISGQDDRGRDLVVLENGNILIAGSGKPSETDINGMLVMLTVDGELDESFGRDGIYQVDLGGKSDSFFSVALSEDESSAIVAGWMGPDAASGGNEEGVIARITL